MATRKTKANGTNKKDVASQPARAAKKKPSQKRSSRIPLHRQMLYDTTFFLRDLECVKEMFTVVLPVLAQKDAERKKEIDKALKKIEKTKTNIKKERSEDIIDTIQVMVESLDKLNRADTMFRTHSIACTISRFDLFFADILRRFFRANPEQFNSSAKSLTYDDLQNLTSISGILEAFIDKEVDRLLRDSHVEQIKFLDSRLKLGIQQSFPRWSDFVEITERRNLFAHTGGIVSPQYLRVCKANGCALPGSVTKGTILFVSQEYFLDAYTCLYELAIWIGQSSVRRLFPKKLKAADDDLIHEIGFPLLQGEEWALAERVFSFGMSLPDKLISNQHAKRLFSVNKAIALRHMGKKEASCKLLDSYDWSSSHPRFLLAVAVLKEKYDDAEKIMRDMGKTKPFSEKAYRTWPLFKDFRYTSQFGRAFRKIYSKTYKPEISPQARKQSKKPSPRPLKEKKPDK